MAVSSSAAAAVLLLLLIASTTNAAVINNDANSDHEELETTLDALRSHGYTLFTNAITTSDLHYQLLLSLSLTNTTYNSFTLFAPTNAPLFSLDMASDAAAYVGSLRYHVVPDRRLTFSDLQSLSSPFLDTLLPDYSILIGKVNDAVSFNGSTAGGNGLMVDGVRVSDPDLFLGPRIAVHGIDGVLETGLNIRNQQPVLDGGSGRISPAESPASSSYGSGIWNIPVDGSPVPSPNGNIPAEGSPAPASNGNIPVDPVSVAPPFPSVGNIPAERILPPLPEFDWSRVPAAAPSFHENIPVEKPSGKIGGPPLNNNLGKKKHGRRHRRHRRHRRDHRLNDL